MYFEEIFIQSSSPEVSDESSRNTPMSSRNTETGGVTVSSQPLASGSSCDSDTEKMFPTEKIFTSQ